MTGSANRMTGSTTNRMTGGANKPDAPVMDLLPIKFSHKVIMMCIEEIKLRGTVPMLWTVPLPAPVYCCFVVVASNDLWVVLQACYSVLHVRCSQLFTVYFYILTQGPWSAL